MRRAFIQSYFLEFKTLKDLEDSMLFTSSGENAFEVGVDLAFVEPIFNVIIESIRKPDTV